MEIERRPPPVSLTMVHRPEMDRSGEGVFGRPAPNGRRDARIHQQRLNTGSGRRLGLADFQGTISIPPHFSLASMPGANRSISAAGTCQWANTVFQPAAAIRTSSTILRQAGMRACRPIAINWSRPGK